MNAFTERQSQICDHLRARLEAAGSLKLQHRNDPPDMPLIEIVEVRMRGKNVKLFDAGGRNWTLDELAWEEDGRYREFWVV